MWPVCSRSPWRLSAAPHSVVTQHRHDQEHLYISARKWYLFHSEIGEQPCIKMLFWQFFIITIYIRVHGKMPHQHVKVLLFANPGDNFLVLVERLMKDLSHFPPLFKTFSPGFENNQHWNVVLATTQHNQIYQGLRKNAGPTFQCIVLLQSRGQGL